MTGFDIDLFLLSRNGSMGISDSGYGELAFSRG